MYRYVSKYEYRHISISNKMQIYISNFLLLATCNTLNVEYRSYEF